MPNWPWCATCIEILDEDDFEYEYYGDGERVAVGGREANLEDGVVRRVDRGRVG